MYDFSIEFGYYNLLSFSNTSAYLDNLYEVNKQSKFKLNN